MREGFSAEDVERVKREHGTGTGVSRLLREMATQAARGAALGGSAGLLTGGFGGSVLGFPGAAVGGALGAAGGAALGGVLGGAYGGVRGEVVGHLSHIEDALAARRLTREFDRQFPQLRGLSDSEKFEYIRDEGAVARLREAFKEGAAGARDALAYGALAAVPRGLLITSMHGGNVVSALPHLAISTFGGMVPAAAAGSAEGFRTGFVQRAPERQKALLDSAAADRKTKYRLYTEAAAEAAKRLREETAGSDAKVAAAGSSQEVVRDPREVARRFNSRSNDAKKLQRSINIEVERGEKRYRHEEPRQMAYGEISRLLNPDDGDPWDVFLAPSASKSDKLKVVGWIPQKGSKNYKLLLAKDGKLTPEDKTIIAGVASRLQSYGKPVMLHEHNSLEIVPKKWAPSKADRAEEEAKLERVRELEKKSACVLDVPGLLTKCALLLRFKTQKEADEYLQKENEDADRAYKARVKSKGVKRARTGAGKSRPAGTKEDDVIDIAKHVSTSMLGIPGGVAGALVSMPAGALLEYTKKAPAVKLLGAVDSPYDPKILSEVGLPAGLKTFSSAGGEVLTDYGENDALYADLLKRIGNNPAATTVLRGNEVFGGPGGPASSFTVVGGSPTPATSLSPEEAAVYGDKLKTITDNPDASTVVWQAGAPIGDLVHELGHARMHEFLPDELERAADTAYEIPSLGAGAVSGVVAGKLAPNNTWLAPAMAAAPYIPKFLTEAGATAIGLPAAYSAIRDKTDGTLAALSIFAPEALRSAAALATYAAAPIGAAYLASRVARLVGGGGSRVQQEQDQENTDEASVKEKSLAKAAAVLATPGLFSKYASDAPGTRRLTRPPRELGRRMR